jgi:DNA-binding ferritin-like protein
MAPPTVPELVMGLLHFRNQLKLYHWQTKGYGAHTALGAAVDALDTQTDELLEVADPLDARAVATMATALPEAKLPASGYANWSSGGATARAVKAQIAKLQDAKRAYAATGLDAVTYLLEEIVGGLLRLAYLLKFDGQTRSPGRRSPSARRSPVKRSAARRSPGKRSPGKRSPSARRSPKSLK